MLSKRNLKSGQDEFGTRVRIFTASLCCERAHGLGLDEFTWEGDTVDSDLPGLRMPGKARHGQGTISYESGDHYTGGWKDDKRSGFGQMTFACGDIYEGEWSEGKYEGHGKYTNTEIGTYEGEWKSNKKHGTGRTCYTTGDVYDGMYSEGFREGVGKYTTAGGEVYMGVFEAGELIKKSKLDRASMLSGTDETGKRVRILTASLCCERAHGLGLDEFTWEGDTVDSDLPGLRMPGKARHGQGTISYESGDHYTGGWKDDKRSGFGQMTFACGDIYEGEWSEGKYEGHGKYTNVEIGTYEGEWKANKKHGTGRSYYSETGDVYDGSYVEGVREGYGTYTKGSGEVRMGRYEKGELVANE